MPPNPITQFINNQWETHKQSPTGQIDQKIAQGGWASLTPEEKNQYLMPAMNLAGASGGMTKAAVGLRDILAARQLAQQGENFSLPQVTQIMDIARRNLNLGAGNAGKLRLARMSPQQLLAEIQGLAQKPREEIQNIKQIDLGKTAQYIKDTAGKFRGRTKS